MSTMKIVGTGSALPGVRVTNFDLEKMVETSDEWIRERTGIVERRISSGETVASLAAQACRNALLDAGKLAEDVQLIIVATCSPEMALPNTACQVQSELKADKAVAFDLSAACAGFVFALNTAYAYIRCGLYQNALVVGAEVLSKLVDWEDRTTCVLFGDGAGAVYVERAEEPGMIAIAQGADGSRGKALTCENRPLQNPYVTAGIGAAEDAAAPDRTVMAEKSAKADWKRDYIHMDGQEIYKFSTRQVPACIREAIGNAGLTAEDIDLFILHQANVRIIEAVAKRLKADVSKFPTNLAQVGNMSSATVPVLLDELNRQGKLKKGMKLVLSGFGAGLTYGACVLQW